MVAFETLLKKIDAQAKNPSPTATQVTRNRGQRIAHITPGKAQTSKNHLYLFDIKQLPLEACIRRAYEIILDRPADPSGFEFYRTMIENQHFTRIELFGGLRYSAEGRLVNCRAPGLFGLWVARKLRKKFPGPGHVAQLPFLCLGIFAWIDMLLKPKPPRQS